MLMMLHFLDLSNFGKNTAFLEISKHFHKKMAYLFR
jgi:hypothetical protein